MDMLKDAKYFVVVSVIIWGTRGVVRKSIAPDIFDLLKQYSIQSLGIRI